jgi:DNA repair protein RecO
VNTLVTRGIVLARTDFGEADRIVTMLTPDRGKLRLMARGVRKPLSKLAGGIELFSTSDLTYLEGKGEIGTLISIRLLKHYGHIVRDLDRVQLGYELIKTLNRATEDHPEPTYYELLEQAFESLDDDAINLELIRIWFDCRLLHLAGHAPNLTTDTSGRKLSSDQTYNFDFDAMAFTPHASGKFSSSHIKFLRLLSAQHKPQTLQKIDGLPGLIQACRPLLQAMAQQSQ